eukprot:CAMPEP_0114338312 /NCGR_PEP_ID=MMETSP0101-20121206/6954_1 /TAXON_ID=38822 ORGANISM="Pteridomonas danica, Strain PT" /NCGR_SAMPLE_ID=MMETSP0101 /ASSEMBLY_ACC=CAM_ASM_000211 /LENGTH=282 /DNA_ID=CAMNT_0001470855 /DNA_START=972 /DNA_END=1820 /DNA_ORIENTATION=+
MSSSSPSSPPSLPSSFSSSSSSSSSTPATTSTSSSPMSYCADVPFLARGHLINPSHSLWTIGMEPKPDALQMDIDNKTEGDDSDVWINSYLNCKVDECFVYVRDVRSIAETPPLNSSKKPLRINEGHEGALLGNGNECGGAYGQCGRFVSGDTGTEFDSFTDPNAPGLPVRPTCPGWLFKLKQTDVLDPILKRVKEEIQNQRYYDDEDEEEIDEFSFMAMSMPPPSQTSNGGSFVRRYAKVQGTDNILEATCRATHGNITRLSSFYNTPIHVIDVCDEDDEE